MADEKIEVENVNHPGKIERVNAEKYNAARAALLKVLPKKAPGITQKEMSEAMRKALSLELFPGTTTSWWMKTVQLDLEAKGIIVRENAKPLRWHKL